MDKILLSFVIDSFLSLFVFYSLYWLFLRNEKTFSFNRYYLITATVLSFIFPFIKIADIFNTSISKALITFSESNLITSSINSENLTAASYSISSQYQEQFHFETYLEILYLIGAAFLLGKFILGIIKLSIILQRNPVQKKTNFTLVYLKDKFSPFSFLRFIFVSEKLKDSDFLLKIINHEIVHIESRHSLDILFIEIASVFQWYNPFVWLVKKSLKETHEFSVDEKVISGGFDSFSYSSFLLNQIVGVRAMNFANCFNQSLIKKRIVMMKKLTSGKFAKAKKLLVFPVAILILAFTIVPPKNLVVSSGTDILSFKNKEGDNVPKGWIKSVANPNAYEVKIDNELKRDGKPTLLIKSLNPTGERDFGNVMQIINAEDYIGKRVKFSGEIKTENVDNFASLWMRVDGERTQAANNNPSLAFDNMANRSPKGTTDWKKYEIVLDVAQNAKEIYFGMMLNRNGKAWFANLNIEEVDNSVPVTNLMRNPYVPSKKPVNLNFSE